MTWLTAILGLVFLMAVAVSCAAPGVGEGDEDEPDLLAGLAWEARPVVLFADSPNDEALQRQRAWLAEAWAGVEERDVVVFEVVGEGVTRGEEAWGRGVAQRLRERLGVEAGGFRFVLIGKDTGVKLRSDEPVTMERLFATIDAMPMRRREMRR